MKILIGYDGSVCANAALRDLQRAGLPAKGDAIVLTIADVWPPAEESADPTHANLDPRIQARVMELRQTAKSKLAEASVLSTAAAATVRALFPGWTVSSEASADSPAWGILKRAGEWKADLIVVGSHGMTARDRFFIGSVSQEVMTHAACSVRIARGRTQGRNHGLHVIVGYDGSVDAEAAIGAAESRSWPDGTEVRVITALDHRMTTTTTVKILKSHRTSSLVEGDPKHVLLQAAADWEADSIFVGATGERGLRRLLLGSVSSAVSAQAPCSVEIVRQKKAS